MEQKRFSWVPFYEELADKLLAYKSNRPELVAKVREAHQIAGVTLPKIESNNDNIPDIDPFTIFALFNRGKQGVPMRQAICKGYKTVFDMVSDVPADFDGVPMYHYNQYCFYRYVGDSRRNDACFTYFWSLFEQALSYSANQVSKAALETTFEQVLQLSLVGQSKMTMALFHIRPSVFVNLDRNNLVLIERELHKTVGTLSGAEYLALCTTVGEYAKSHLNASLPAFSSMAYENRQQSTEADDENRLTATAPNRFF